MRLTWSLSRGDAQSLGFSVISLLGDVDREKGRKTRDIKRGRNLRRENQPLGLLYIENSYLCKICIIKRNQASNSFIKSSSRVHQEFIKSSSRVHRSTLGVL